MNRSEAIALMNELLAANLIQPSLVDLDEKDNGVFDLVLRVQNDLNEYRRFISGKNLVLYFDENKRICRIYTP